MYPNSGKWLKKVSGIIPLILCMLVGISCVSKLEQNTMNEIVEGSLSPDKEVSYIRIPGHNEIVYEINNADR